VTEGNWLADQVRRYGCGVIVEKVDPGALVEAIETIRLDYDRYASRAREAGDVMRRKNSGVALAKLLKEDFGRQTRHLA